MKCIYFFSTKMVYLLIHENAKNAKGYTHTIDLSEVAKIELKFSKLLYHANNNLSKDLTVGH